MAVFGVLIYNDLFSLESIKTAISRWPWLLMGWGCMACTTLISILRWHFLIRAQQIAIPMRRSVQSALVGVFFNTFLPGSLSGDVVKGYYVARAVPGHTAEIISSILFDRVIGLTGLIALAVIALVAGGGGSWAGMLGLPIVLAVAGVASAVTVFYAALLGIGEDRDPILKVLRHLARRFALVKGPLRIYEGVRVYHRERRVTLLSIAASVLAHGLLVVGWVCFVRAMALDQIPSAALFVAVPIGMLVAAIPIGPAGMGTGHAAFLAIFALLGSNRGADLFNLALGFQFIQGAVGGVVYLSIKANDPIPRDVLEGGVVKKSS